MALIKRNTAYSVNDIVNTRYGIKLKCTTAGTTSTDPLILDGTSPITDGTVIWEVQEEQGGQGLVDYEANKNYNVGDIVIYDNKIYKCITAHTSTSTFDNTKWREISASESGSGVIGSFALSDNDMINCGSLVRFNASPIVDEFNEFSWDFSNASLNSTTIKYEPSSLACGGSSKCYSICDDMLSQLFVSGFTIDFWAYIYSTSSGGLIYIGTMNGGDAYQILEMYNVHDIYTQHTSRGSVTHASNIWQYWSLNFYDNNLYIFIDGKLSLTCYCPYNSNSSNGIYINSGRTSDRYFSGYISDFKITKYVKHTNIEFESPLDKPKNTISYNFLTDGIYRDTISNLVVMSKNDSNIFSDLNMIQLNK